MRQDVLHGHGRHRRSHDGHRGDGRRHTGAQTFRRGRVLDFLQRLNVKRATLLQQLEQPELQAIHAVITGELKAIDMVRNEFIDVFELHEDVERDEQSDESTDTRLTKSELKAVSKEDNAVDE